jgi:type IV secretion system protein TrbH
MRMWILLIALAAALSGCQTSGRAPDDDPKPAGLSPAAASAIAGDLSARLAEQAPPKGTTIRMAPDRTDFGIAFGAALKGWGYSVNPEAQTETMVKLDYAVEQSGEDVLASVALPSVVLSRTYTASTAGAAPKSPLSILRRD